MKHPGVHFESKNESTGGGSSREPKAPKQTDKKEHDQMFSFSCFQCGGGLRIRLPQAGGAYRCPKCHIEFKVSKASDSPSVFVVLPDLSKFSSRNSKAPERPPRAFPREIQIALSSLNLEGTPSFEDVRRAYRELVQAYHPDKVAHLGPDLKRVAEAKTKEINAAYNVLEKFFAN